jgi:hypothetical protein
MVDPDLSWDSFLADYRESHSSWLQAPGALVRQWIPHVGPEHVHVVTVPKRGASRHLLLHRFAHILGLDAASLRTEGANANTSLGAVEVEFLRAVTARTAARLDRRAQRDLIGRMVPLLQGLDLTQQPVRLPAPIQHLMREASAHDIRALTETGSNIHGDLDELMPDEEELGNSRTSTLTISQNDLMNLAIDALVVAVNP